MKGARESLIVRQFRTKAVLLAVLGVCSITTWARVPQSVPSGAYGSVEPQATRGYFSEVPLGMVDMVTGNLTISIPGFVLPGNAGMDVRIMRNYSYQPGDPQAMWSLTFTDVPLRVDEAYDAQNVVQRTLVMGDGSRKKLHDGVMAGFLVTTDFWRYEPTTRILHLPDGRIARYDVTTGSPPFYPIRLSKVEDPYGNELRAYWAGAGAAAPIDYIEQTVSGANGNQTRVVDFSDDSNGTVTVTYDGRTWTYTTTTTTASIQPPTGPAWTFARTGALSWADPAGALTATLPTGGTVTYDFVQSNNRWRVNQITTGGREVAAGTWQLSFTTGTPQTSTVTCPSGRVITYTHEYVAGAEVTDWLLKEQAVSLGSDASSVQVTYEDVPFASNPTRSLKVPSTQVFTQDGLTFTTQYEYHESNFKDFLRPWRITETASSHAIARVTTRTFDYNFTTHWIINRVGSQTLTQEGQSFSTSSEYDDVTGALSSATRLGITTQFSVDAGGNVASGTDPSGHQTSAEFLWGVVGTVASSEATFARTINPDGTAASEAHGGAVTGFLYDALGRIRYVFPPEGATMEISYAADGSSVSVSRADTWVTTTVDGFGRPIRSENAAGVRTSTSYDSEGRMVFRSAPYTSAPSGDTMTYDGLGRVRRVTHADGSFYRFDPAGASVVRTDENGHQSTQYFQAFGTPGNARMTQIHDGSQYWAYSYNALGSLTRVDGPEGPDRVWVYNGQNQLESETQPESGTTTYTYRPDGLLWTRTNGLGMTTYSYEGHQLTGMDAPGTADDTTIAYDARGNRSQTTLGNGNSTGFTYDFANRLTSRTEHVNGRVFVTGFGYDSKDNVTSITYPSSRTVQYGYDVANRITRVWSGEQTYADGFTYHPSGARATVTFGNNTHETLELDDRQRPKHLTTGSANDPVDLTYGYDGEGNVTSILDPRPGKSAWYGYDTLDRLTTVTGFGANTFTYDAQGNRLTSNGTTYTYDSATNRLSSVTSPYGFPYSASSLQYDVVGNLVVHSDAPTGVTTSFDHSPRGTMTRATVTSPTVSSITDYTYDADGLRIQKSSGTGQRYFVRGLGGQLLAEYTATGGGPLVLARESLYLGSTLLATIDCDPSLNQAPIVALTAPTSGNSYATPATIGLTAQASDPGGSIVEVAFYANDVRLGADTTAPYTFDWAVSTPATYALTAVAQDNRGARTVSSVVSVTVANTGPRMNWALAANGGTATASSTYPQWDFAPSSAVNGDRTGAPFGGGGIWNDATGGDWPDWLEISFNGFKSIDQVDVFSEQDNYGEPVEPTSTMTTGNGLRDFEIQYWNGTSWLSIPGASVTGNTLVWKQVTFSPVVTDRIRIHVSNTTTGWTAVAEVEAWGVVAPPSQVLRANWAVTTNGGTATASSTYTPWDFSPSAAINGDRRGYPFGGGGIWNDATWGQGPDWLDVTFQGNKIIDEVRVFSEQDNYAEPVEPTPTMTTANGLSDFEIQYWNGAAWVPIPGAWVTGNTLVWKTLTFSAVITNKIRVRVSATFTGWTAIAEVEAWGTATDLAPDQLPTGAPALFYHHADILGSVRATTDASGAPVVRHDYFSFGESQSTSVGDQRRFLGEERDAETGLDQFGARYYRNVWGRFMTADNSIYTNVFDPRSFNLYSYTNNSPLSWIDPTGHFPCPPDTNRSTCVSGNLPVGSTGVDAPYWQDPESDLRSMQIGLFRAGASVVGRQHPFIRRPPEAPQAPTPPVNETGQTPAATQPCTAPTNTPDGILSLSITSPALGALAGGAIGARIGGAPGAVLGVFVGSSFQIGGSASFVPSTKTWYAGWTASLGSPSLSPVNFTGSYFFVLGSGQNANAIADGLSYSATFLPWIVGGGTFMHSPGNGTVFGLTAGTKTPAAVSVGKNYRVIKGGC